MSDKVILCLLEDDRTWSIPIIDGLKKRYPGVEVKSAPDGKSFCRLLSEAPPPVLVILDINVLGMSGIMVLKAIRAREDLGWLQVVMYTTDESFATRVECLRAGANGFFLKNVKTIDQVVGEIVDKHIYKGKLPALIAPILKETDPIGEEPDIDSMLNQLRGG